VRKETYRVAIPRYILEALHGVALVKELVASLVCKPNNYDAQ
jgi:hypothetical protein